MTKLEYSHDQHTKIVQVPKLLFKGKVFLVPVSFMPNLLVTTGMTTLRIVPTHIQNESTSAGFLGTLLND